MGRTYRFECNKCGYRAEVAGGTERGVQLVVQTIHCIECRELRDVVTELKVPDTYPGQLARGALQFNQTETAPAPTFQEALNPLPRSQEGRFRWDRYRAICPVAAWHQTRAWKQPGKCPKCGVFLEGGAIPYKVWD